MLGNGALPGKPLPSMARHYAPSLCGRQGEGRGGGGFGPVALRVSRLTCSCGLAGHRGSAEPCSATGPYRESLCRAWLGTTPPPFAVGKGRAGEGLVLGLLLCGFRGSPALAASPDTAVVPSHARQRGPYRESPCRAWLGTTPPPFAAGKGRAGEGLASALPCRQNPCQTEPSAICFCRNAAPQNALGEKLMLYLDRSKFLAM